jgi:hypothetical protein
MRRLFIIVIHNEIFYNLILKFYLSSIASLCAPNLSRIVKWGQN